MRVLSVIHYPVFGGPHNRNTIVANLLRANGVDTIVLLPDEPGNARDRLERAGVRVATLPLGRIRASLDPVVHLKLLMTFWLDVRAIRSLIRNENIDLVQINGLVNVQSAFAARFERIPVVWQLIDTYAPMLLRRLIMPVVQSLASVVMSTGRRVAMQHPGAVGFGDRLVEFYPPVSLSQFSPDADRRSRARQEFGLSKETFVVGNVSNINPQKGHETFIRAAALLKRRLPDVRFVILGATSENHREFAEDLWRVAIDVGLKMGDDLIVRDPQTGVADLEPAFDVFWMTSEPRSEGIPTAIEEAMCLGIPVVSTDVGAISEILIDEDTGFVVAPRDVLAFVERTVQLYADMNLREAMSGAARQFALRNFGSDMCARTHRRAYDLAVGGKSSKT